VLNIYSTQEKLKLEIIRISFIVRIVQNGIKAEPYHFDAAPALAK
jgi:hypothetical protein